MRYDIFLDKYSSLQTQLQYLNLELSSLYGVTTSNI